MSNDIPVYNDVFDFKAARQSLCGFIKTLFDHRQQTIGHLLVMLLHSFTQFYTQTDRQTQPENITAPTEH